MTDESFDGDESTPGKGEGAEAEDKSGLLFELSDSSSILSFSPSSFTVSGTTGKLLGDDDALLSPSTTGSGEFPKTW